MAMWVHAICWHFKSLLATLPMLRLGGNMMKLRPCTQMQSELEGCNNPHPLPTMYYHQLHLEPSLKSSELLPFVSPGVLAVSSTFLPGLEILGNDDNKTRFAGMAPP